MGVSSSQVCGHHAVNGGFAGQSRKHMVKLELGYFLRVEEVVLALGQITGRSSVKSAACMNKVLVLFLGKVEQVNMMERSCWIGCLFRLLQ